MAGNLHASARRGDFKGVKTMIEVYKDDPNNLDVHGMTALHYGSKRGHYQIVAYLLQSKADLEIKNATGQSPLMTASQAGKLECCELLVASGADPNADADHGVRPLHRASEAGHEEVVRLLLRAKADPLAVDEFMAEGAIHLAAREGHYEVLRCIMGVVPRQSEKEVQDEDDELDAGSFHLPGQRKRRLDDGNNKGETALHLAAGNGRLESCRLLLTMGSTASWRSWYMAKKDGRQQDTALHKACEAGHAEVARLLLDSDSNPNTTNLLGRSPLHLATKSGSDTVVTFLLRAGADHLAVDHDGRRPAGAGNGTWDSAVPRGVESESVSHLPTPLRKERARLNEASNVLFQDVERQKARRRAAQVKMMLTDIGSGATAGMHDFLTNGRKTFAQNRRVAEKLEKESWMGINEEGLKRIEKEAQARARRMEVRRVEAEMEEICDRMRAIWAQKKVAAAWKVYKVKMEAERRERERQRRKAEAQRQRVLQANLQKAAVQGRPESGKKAH